MKNSIKICAKNEPTKNSGSASDPGRPKTRKSTSKRNHNPVSRFFGLLANGKATRKTAIEAMCAQCMGCSAKEQGFPQEAWIEAGFRQQIRNCSSPHCPLWTFRPFQRGAE